MAIAFRSQSSIGASTAGSQAVGSSLPTGTTTGDVTFAFISIKVSGATNTPTATGWTKLGQISNAGNTVTTTVFWRAFVAGDTQGPTVNWSSSAKYAYTYVTYSGVDTTTPIDASATFAATGTTVGGTMADASVAAVTSGAWRLSLFGFDVIQTEPTRDYRMFPLAGSGFGATINATGGSTATRCSLTVVHEARLVAGATGTRIWTMQTAGNAAGFSIWVRPATADTMGILQTARSAAGGLPPTATFPNALTAGSLIVAVYGGTANTATGFTYTGSNLTLTKAIEEISSAPTTSIWYYPNNTSTASSIAVTGTTTGTGSCYLLIMEIKGAATSSPLDAQGSSFATTTAFTVSTTGATTSGDRYGVDIAYSTAASSVVPDATWDTRVVVPPNGFGPITTDFFAGGSTASNALTSASSTWSGVIAVFKIASSSTQTPQALLATKTSAGAFVRSPGKKLLATKTNTVTIKKNPAKALKATKTSAGAFLKSPLKKLLATKTSAAVVGRSKQFTKIFAATKTSAAAFLKRPGKIVKATKTSTATFVKQPSRKLLATKTSVATFLKRPGKLVKATKTSVGAFVKQPSRKLLATKTSVGAFVKQPSRKLLATKTSATTITKSPGKKLLAPKTSAGAFLKGIGKKLLAPKTSTAVIGSSKAFLKALLATKTSAGLLGKQPGKFLTTPQTSAGRLGKQPSRALLATITTATTFLKQISKLATTAATNIAAVVGTFVPFGAPPNIVFLEPGTDATQAFEFWSTVTGTVTRETTITNGFPSAIKCDSGAASTANVKRSGIMSDAGRRVSFWFRFGVLPSGTTTKIMAAETTSTGTYPLSVNLRSDGKLSVITAGTTTVGTTTVSINTWYRISVAYTITSTTSAQVRVFLNGTLEITVSPTSSVVVGTDALRLGWFTTSPGTNSLCYIRDVYVDDSSALTDPGEIYVTAKRPAAAGSTNAFDTLGGTGTNRWDRVAERPISITNYLAHAATTQVSELFTIEAAAVGDVDLTGKTLLGYGGWVWSKAGTGTLSTGTAGPGVTLAGTTTNITLTTTAALYRVYNATATYPSTNQAIGMRSNTNTADTFFYEGGVLIAYIPTVNVTTPKALLATFTNSGLFRRQPGKIVKATKTSAATVVKSPGKIIKATKPSNATVRKQPGRNLRATQSNSVVFVRRTSKLVRATLTEVATILANFISVITTNQTLVATLNSAGHFTRAVGTALYTAQTSAKHVQKAVATRLYTTRAATAVRHASVTKRMTGTQPLVAAIVRLRNRLLSLVATLASRGAFQRGISFAVNSAVVLISHTQHNVGKRLRTLGTLLSFDFTQRIGKRIAVSQPTAAALLAYRAVLQQLTAILLGVGRMTRRAGQLLQTAQPLAGALHRQAGKNLRALTTSGSTIRRQIGFRVAAIESILPDLVKRITPPSLVTALTSAAAAARSVGKSLPTTSSLLSRVVRSVGKRVRATPTPLATMIRQRRIVQRIVALVPLVSKIRRNLTYALRALQPNAPVIIKRASKRLPTAQGNTPLIQRSSGKRVRAPQTSTGRFVRSAGKRLRAAQTSVAALRAVRAFLKLLRATVATPSTFVRQVRKSVRNITVVLPAVRKGLKQKVAATLTSFAALSHSAHATFSRGLTASLTTVLRFHRDLTFRIKLTMPGVPHVIKQPRKIIHSYTTIIPRGTNQVRKRLVVLTALGRQMIRNVGHQIRAMQPIPGHMIRTIQFHMLRTQSMIGRVARQLGQRLRALQTSAGRVRRQVQPQLRATTSPISHFGPRTLNILRRAVSPLVGIMTRGQHLSQQLHAVVVELGHVRNQVGKTLDSFGTIIPALFKRPGKRLRANQPSSEAMQRNVGKQVDVTLPVLARMMRRVLVLRRVIQATTTTMLRAISRRLRVLQATPGRIQKAVTTQRRATTTPLAQIARDSIFGRVLATSVILIGTMHRQTSKILVQSQAVATRIQRQITHRLSLIQNILPRVLFGGQHPLFLSVAVPLQAAARKQVGALRQGMLATGAALRKRATLLRTTTQSFATALTWRRTISSVLRATQTTVSRLQNEVRMHIHAYGTFLIQQRHAVGVILRALPGLIPRVRKQVIAPLVALQTTLATTRRQVGKRIPAPLTVWTFIRRAMSFRMRATQTIQGFVFTTLRGIAQVTLRATQLTTGFLHKQVQPRIHAYLTILAGMTKLQRRILAATVMVAGAVRKQFVWIRRITLPSAGALSRRAGKVLHTTVGHAAAQSRRVGKQIHSYLTIIPRLGRTFKANLLVLLALATPPFRRQITATRRAVLVPLSAMQRQTGHRFRAALGVLGRTRHAIAIRIGMVQGLVPRIARRMPVALRATLATVARLRKGWVRVLAATILATGTLRRRIGKLLPWGLNSAAALHKRVSITRRTGQTFILRLGRRAQLVRAMRATLDFGAAIRRMIGKRFRGSEGTQGAFGSRQIGKQLRATVALITRFRRAMTRYLRAALHFVVQLSKQLRPVLWIASRRFVRLAAESRALALPHETRSTGLLLREDRSIQLPLDARITRLPLEVRQSAQTE